MANIQKSNTANIPKIQKAMYPHIPKIDPSIIYPFKYLQKYPFKLLVNIHVSLKTILDGWLRMSLLPP